MDKNTQHVGKSPQQDPEVMKRVREIDRLAEIQRDWQASSDSLNISMNVLYAKQQQLEDKQIDLNSVSNQKYESAVESYDLKVFLIRLLFVAPILALGIFFFVRFRNKRMAPLYLGFSLFSVYVFFVGLVPYLPSYGGYIRYTVGILLTIGLGYYAIKRIRVYSEQKRKELEESSKERANKLQFSIVEKSFDNHICPSCGKDFLLKPWEKGVKIDANTVLPISGYCRFCGLQLMRNCPKCNHANFAHLPFCVECGSKLKEEVNQDN